MLKQRMRCDVPIFSPANYDYITQCYDKRPRFKVLNDLKNKYSISQNAFIRFGEMKKKIGLYETS